MLIPNAIVVGQGGLPKIAEASLAVAEAAITVSSIPQTHSHLLVFVTAKRSTATNDSLGMRINGDSGANYDFQRIDGGGTSITTAEGLAQTSANVGGCSGESSPSSNTNVVLLPFYRETDFEKTIHSLGQNKRGTATTNLLARYSIAYWRSSSAITSLTFIPLAGGNLAAGSKAIVYGV